MKLFIVIVAAALGISGIAYADDAGKENFEKKCATCHGKDGTGKTPMGEKLKAKDLTATAVAEDKIMAAMQNGIPDKKMPAFKDKLSDDEMKGVAAYVKAFKK
jgi:mono/diheme cytochrome c family protein